jgi:hypothetical protein
MLKREQLGGRGRREREREREISIFFMKVSLNPRPEKQMNNLFPLYGRYNSQTNQTKEITSSNSNLTIVVITFVSKRKMKNPLITDK